MSILQVFKVKNEIEAIGFPFANCQKYWFSIACMIFFSKYHSGILATYFTRKKAKIDESLEKFWFIQFEIQF
jgi:hypothetical protein